MQLEFDVLERIQLLSTGTGVHHTLGTFIAPSVVVPRVFQPVPIVDPHVAINNYLTSILGPSIQPIQQVVENQNTSQHSSLVDRVLSDPFTHGTLSDQDTYTLLTSPGMSALIGFSQAPDTVTYIVPPTAIISVIDSTATVAIPSSGGLQGFVVDVPTSDLRTLPSGLIAVLVPTSEVPPNAPPPSTISPLTGAFADVFSSQGPLINSALNSGLPIRAPNAPRTVPGLRLSRGPSLHRHLPPSSAQFLRMFHVAVDRGVFNLGPIQQDQVLAALQQFDAVVNVLNQEGAFTPAVPPAPPPLPVGPLNGTLEVSTGALRNLVNVAAGQNGLQLPEIGNFPGRLDVGYVFAHNGDYGLMLTLRGALSPAPPFPPVDDVGSTIQIEASNAPGLAALDGLRTVEGLSIGTALMGTVSTSINSAGVSTYATSAGYGSGMEYGTGMAYTMVIPLGNVNALIPQSPPSR
jgi:hypothetical protein